MNGAIPPLPLYIFVACTGVTLNFSSFQCPETKVQNGELKNINLIRSVLQYDSEAWTLSQTAEKNA